MLRENEEVFTVAFLIVGSIAFFCVIGFLRNKRRGRLREKVRTLLPKLHLAKQEYLGLIDFNNYFSNFQATAYVAATRPLLSEVPVDYKRIGLKGDEVKMISDLDDIIKSIGDARQRYNDEFVRMELDRYKDFFSKLENYPLSREQMEAVVRDEDNNLVIAGAGTGKTTTVSAKVAYLLEKKLAVPEDLLIISFTKTAVAEMFDRCVKFCKSDFADGELEVRTFNAFGYMVNRYCSTQGLKLAFDGDDSESIAFLRRTFEHLFLSDDGFSRSAINFIAFFDRPYKSDFSFESQDELLKHEKSYSNRALTGQKMKSGQEVQIANFLFLNSIDFEYEKFFPLTPEDRNPKYGDYCPDFYLSAEEIWLEHYGIDDQGNVPPYFGCKPPYRSAREQYHDGMQWKEGIHTKYQTKFLKTYSFEAMQGKLIFNLRKRLENLGVKIVPRPIEEIFKAVQELPEFEGFIKLLNTFLGLMKSNNKTPADFSVFRKKDKRLKVFIDVFTAIYQRYQAELASKSAIDFNDMVNKASELIRNGSYTKKYKYILVDEFQDMSVSRYKLLKSLLDSNPGSKLYAVGDDWQSIFRFTGTDLSIMTSFEKQFGYTQLSKIAMTYRFNSEILELTSNFVQKNPAQIQKVLLSDSVPLEPSFQLIGLNLNGMGKEGMREMAKWERIDAILQRLPGKGFKTVFLVGRYNHSRPKDFNELVKRHPALNLTFFTAHTVKGLTCDCAIILDVDAGMYGFPSEVADDPILDYLLHEGENFENAEERRLFYVALTRAKHKVYLLYDSFSPSKFILELAQDIGIVEDKNAVVCPACKGKMILREGKFSNFYGCSNYPDCTTKLPFVDKPKMKS